MSGSQMCMTWRSEQRQGMSMTQKLRGDMMASYAGTMPCTRLHRPP